MRHEEHRNTDPIDASHGFELRDITLSIIVKWVLSLFAFMAFSAFLAYLSYLAFLPSNKATTSATDSPMLANRPTEPPKPQLQAYPKSEMRDFRADEDAKVNGTAPLDKNSKDVHISVDDAMKKLAAGNDLPTQQTSSSSTGYDPTGKGRNWPAPQPVGTESGYKPPVVYRKYPY